MSSAYILNEVKSGPIMISQHLVEDVERFKVAKNVPSMKSIALIMVGHTPIKDIKFDRDALDLWCAENNLQHFFEERERMYHFKQQ
jgi:hypothetical protein